MERRIFSIRGIVQGVGFRPFVHGLATRLGLCGFVKNHSGEVIVEAEGDGAALDDFTVSLRRDLPPRATIVDFAWRTQTPKGERGFRIAASSGDASFGDASSGEPTDSIFIAPDSATCRDCLRELFDPGDRRYRYPFNNCTNCGPRLTIITAAPYDRERTTMAGFAMCAACRAEYDDPADRRFHAQPIACPTCGPQLTLCDNAGRAIVADDPFRALARRLADGAIAAVKGLGGYHLACDASNEAAVSELRRRKRRDEKPFAIMAANLEIARLYGDISPAAAECLVGPQRPIVLVRKRIDPEGAPVAESVAPGNPFLGIMLPYTPLHHLLMEACGPRPLIMTSGNRSDEPIAYDDADAFARLADCADVFLVHNRPIHVRCEDSVLRADDDVVLPLRRSRGYAPQPIALPFACPMPILAVGGQLKSTFALGRDASAFVSHHLGDLDHYEAGLSFERDIRLYEDLFACVPQLVVHDLHPDYASTRYAQRRGIRTLAVQHHHAHLASCMAENGLAGPVIGVIFDGAGYGNDGAIWGGEFLIGDYRSFRRAAHLRNVGMPGGEQASREPWRMAVAHLLDAQVPLTLLKDRIAAASLKNAVTMLERGFRSPLTSSFGRLFDAVAALVGLRDRARYEGQASQELEGLASAVADCGCYAFDIVATNDLIEIDPRPLIREIAADRAANAPPAAIARRFHAASAAMIVAVCRRLHAQHGLDRVIFSGGVFANALLTALAKSQLEAAGLTVFRHRVVPPGDGGLSLGQLAIAAHQGTDENS